MKKSLVKSEITSAAIFRCTAKCTFTEKGVTIHEGQSFYRVNSDTVNDSYIICWNGHQLVCSCPARCECKHLRGVKEVMAERKQYQKQQVTPAAIPASYDVIGESLKVVNQAMADLKIADHYELVGAMHQAQQSELGSCDCCGYPVKQGFTTCGKCAGY